jgi:propionyl-CoA carboxylase alpha chain
MGEAALAVVRACGYTNAGTVEFLVDAQRNFYFLEMNTRLQVEHPVTECITGLDLVAQQILVAEGHPLAFAQEDLQINGHAIEVRVYAEDPLQNFLPSTGRLEVYRPPTGPGIRVDDGFREGMDVPIFYDPMLAKLIVHAPTRAEAIARLTQAIDDYAVVGVETTLDFCRFVLQHPAFQSGKFDTHFVQQHFTPDALQRQLGTDEMEVAALIAGLVHHREQHAAAHSLPARIAAAADTNPWHQRRM